MPNGSRLYLSLGAVLLINLLDEYLDSLATVRRALRQAQQRRDNHNDEQAALDYQQLTSMERDLLWAVEYLETGRVPDYHRGVHRWTVPVDPQLLQRMIKARANATAKPRWVTRSPELGELLGILTPREKEAFVLVRGQGISFRQTARYMGVRSPGTVSNLVRRAERKVRRAAANYEEQSA
jgi:DNA-directed RNA polymerase specialized sigma24 family protein